VPTQEPQPIEPSWLIIGRELRAIAQIGLAFSQDPFNRHRYERIRELAASLIAQRTGLDDGTMVDYFRRETGYATPKVDVRAAAFLEGKVLLVREISDGAWTLPGGWADVNQTAAECVVREVAEESGYLVRAVKLAAEGGAGGLGPGDHFLLEEGGAGLPPGPGPFARSLDAALGKAAFDGLFRAGLAGLLPASFAPERPFDGGRALRGFLSLESAMVG
jgi:hypothetical protein